MTTAKPTTDQAHPDGGAATRPHGGARQPTATRGRTIIADGVVQKIAGIAAREVSGVFDLGGGAARMVGAVRERMPGTAASVTQGVTVEVGDRLVAVDLDLVAEYGVSIADLCEAVRRNVINSVERMTGLEVSEVDITVDDVHLPGDEPAQPSGTRS